MNVAAPSITGDSCHSSSTASANIGRRKECTFAVLQSHEYSHCSDKFSFVKNFNKKYRTLTPQIGFAAGNKLQPSQLLNRDSFVTGKPVLSLQNRRPFMLLPKEEKRKKVVDSKCERTREIDKADFICTCYAPIPTPPPFFSFLSV